MCQNIFKNEEKKERKESFTRLFVSLASSMIKGQQTMQKTVANNK